MKAAYKIDKNNELQVLSKEEICLNHKIDSKKSKGNNSKFTLNNQQISSQILDILNDDCIQEIFRLLSYEDLASVADVCIRFRDNAKILVGSRFAVVNIEPFNDRIELERLFRNFGSSIKSVAINDLSNQQDYEKSFLLLTKYCSAMLKEFRYTYHHYMVEYEYKPVPMVHKRTFHCDPTRFDLPEYTQIISVKNTNFLCEFLKSNRQLKKLEVANVITKGHDVANFFHIIGTITELEELKLSLEYSFVRYADFSIYISDNLSKLCELKELSLEHLHIKTKVIKDLLKMLPNLHKLHSGEKNYQSDPITKDDILEIAIMSKKLTYLSVHRHQNDSGDHPKTQ